MVDYQAKQAAAGPGFTAMRSVTIWTFVETELAQATR